MIRKTSIYPMARCKAGHFSVPCPRKPLDVLRVVMPGWNFTEHCLALPDVALRQQRGYEDDEIWSQESQKKTQKPTDFNRYQCINSVKDFGCLGWLLELLFAVGEGRTMAAPGSAPAGGCGDLAAEGGRAPARRLPVHVALLQRLPSAVTGWLSARVATKGARQLGYHGTGFWMCWINSHLRFKHLRARWVIA